MNNKKLNPAPNSSNLTNSKSTAIQPEVLPSLDGSKPPEKAELGSRFDEMNLKDGLEILTDAADFIPGLGTALKKGLGVGDSSDDARLKERQHKWMVNEVAKISQKIDFICQTLPKEEQIQPADVASIFVAALEASKRTADFNKRRLLKNALLNAFDVEQYREGLTLRLFRLIEELEYGDIMILRKLFKEQKSQTSDKPQGLIKFNIKYEGSMEHHHVKILTSLGLVESLGRDNSKVIKVRLNQIGIKLLNFTQLPN